MLVALGLCGPTFLGACQKGKAEGSSEKGAAKTAVLTKKISELDEPDLKAAATAMGWGDKPTTTHSKGSNETIIVSASKEDPEGTDSPDGKKRVRMSLGLYIQKDAADAERQKTSLEGDGYAVQVEGNRVLATRFYKQGGPDKAKSQAILDQLFGK